MARELRLPELAESVVEGEIIRWLVAEGDSVALDQPVAEVLTDKATVELPSPFAGRLVKHLAAEGDVVQVNAVIALIEEGGGSGAGATASTAAPAAGGSAGGSGEGATAGPGSASASGAPSGTGEDKASGKRSPAAESGDDGDKLSLFKPSAGGEAEALPQVRRPVDRSGGARAVPGQAAKARQTVAGGGAQAANGAAQAPREPARGAFGRVLAVPAARRLARELGVSIEEVLGSGPHGRVRVDDVREHTTPAGQGHAGPQGSPIAYKTPAGYEGREERAPMRGLRRLIANQMVTSHLHTVRALHVDEADVTDLVALREKLKPGFAAKGVRLSYLPFVMKAVAVALAEFPALNSSFDEAKGEIVTKRYYNIGMATATDAGLVVPVIRDVDERSIMELAAEVGRLADLARSGKLAPDDLKGGTFSVTNIGSLGGLFSFPIINSPEAAILGVHSIKKRPVVMADDSIRARQMLYLSLSFDHRLVDGAEGALFTSKVIGLLENPVALLLDL
ncbi:MAG: 2-oxo acid dehydrogenase subunit E2 [Trueperaceae bacterium]|nr:2-oxo acid dehydrogenase subunit E2 [Trueperaceae bacterium]MCO5174745.1 2-oxo acid dehydrogenase subunit E2 [Trueperaceae bacterium]